MKVTKSDRMGNKITQKRSTLDQMVLLKINMNFCNKTSNCVPIFVEYLQNSKSTHLGSGGEFNVSFF